VYITNISKHLNQDHLTKYFTKYGEVEETRIIHDPQKIKSKGFGFVLFSDGEALTKVLNEGHTHTIEGHTIDCRPTMLREELRSGVLNETSSNSNLDTFSITTEVMNPNGTGPNGDSLYNNSLLNRNNMPGYQPFYPEGEANNLRKDSGKNRFSLDNVSAHIPGMHPMY
jgi:RNA recognition motif-containing protein